jgi:hypothetical protein
MTDELELCPLENTWCGQFCSMLPEHQKNQTIHLCEHKFECNNIKESLLNNINYSLLLTNQILLAI